MEAALQPQYAWKAIHSIQSNGFDWSQVQVGACTIAGVVTNWFGGTGASRWHERLHIFRWGSNSLTRIPGLHCETSQPTCHYGAVGTGDAVRVGIHRPHIQLLQHLWEHGVGVCIALSADKGQI